MTGRAEYVYLLCVIFTVIPGEKGESTLNTDATGIHVVALSTEEHESRESENQLLHSACRLGYTNVKVLRDWCPTGNCKDDLRLEDHLKDLPLEDRVFIINPGKEFVYLMADPERVKQELTESGENLIFAQLPDSEDDNNGERETEEEEDKGQGTDKRKELGEQENGELTTAGEERENGESKADKQMNNGESVSDNEIENNNKDEEGRKGKNMSEGEEENRNKEEENPILHALQGGTVIARVGSILQVIRDQEMPQYAMLDTSAQYVLFGNRIKGDLGVEVPIRARFIPVVGGERKSTSPFVIYSTEDKLDFYNIIHYGGDGPQYCSFTQEQPFPQNQIPRILVSLDFAGAWVPFLEEVLQGLLQQTYPKERMDIWIHAKSGIQEREIEQFKVNGSSYSSIEVIKDESVDMISLRSKCMQKSCDYAVVMHPEVLLENPETLSSLVASNRPVVGPLLTEYKKKPKSNFRYTPDATSQWEELINKRKIKGILKVLEIKSFVLYRKDALDNIEKGDKPRHFINNVNRAGFLLDFRGYKEGKLHPDLWGMRHNRFLWIRRYVHPDVLKVIKKEKKPELVGSYLYYMPFYTERFCKDMIEEMEYHGKWYDKSEDTRDSVSHIYSSRNTNFEDIDYALDYHIILNSVHRELLAAVYDDYRGMGEASLIFVLKYGSAEEYNTFKYHLDGATYTFNIALNSDFTGGGLQFKLGNALFGDEEEFVVPHNRTGWVLMQPDRPLHTHRGVALETGTRYALINIIDTSDENCKGGPAWLD